MTEVHRESWLFYLSLGRWCSRDESVAVPARSLPIPKGLGLQRICEPIDVLVEYGRIPLAAAQRLMRLTNIG